MVREAQYKGLKSWSLVKTQKISTSPLIAIFNILHISILLKPIKNNDGTGGTVIILDNSAKEVLALASYPSYNPNNPMRSIKKIELFLKAMSLDQSLNR